MAEFQKVRGSHEISIRAADLLEDMRPQDYNGSNRAGTVRTINDILQGRAQRTVDSFLLGLRNTGGDGYAQRVEEVCQDVQAFLTQKALLSQPYTKSSSKQYKYRTFDLDPKHPLKIINQRLYDLAAKAGFPPGFFEQSYFDHVTIYCIPDGTRCSDSVFQDCTFSVCRLVGVEFWDARLNSCAFQSCHLQYAVFPDAALSYTHFYDCDLCSVGFIRSRLAHCNTIDCTVKRLDFAEVTLDGCSYGRITRTPDCIIKGLEQTVITCGGATDEEVKRLRASIFEALQVPDLSLVQRPKVTRRRPRRTGPER